MKWIMLLLACVLMLGCKTPHEKAKEAALEGRWTDCLEYYNECDSLSVGDLMIQIASLYNSGQVDSAKSYAIAKRHETKYWSEAALAKMCLEAGNYLGAIVWVMAAKDHGIPEEDLRPMAERIVEKAGKLDYQYADEMFAEFKQTPEY